MTAVRTGGEQLQAAEFFAGIGLVGLALERVGVKVAWANDIDPVKAKVFGENLDGERFRLDDVRNVSGKSMPRVDLATASFPCTDLSLAGNRAGLGGEQSGMFWEFARIIGEMDRRRPRVVMLENVPGFATSRGGADIRSALIELNRLGYSCDVFQVDAARFLPQSRPRMFIVGVRSRRVPSSATVGNDWARPANVERVYAANADLRLHRAGIPVPPPHRLRLANAVERIPAASSLWWDAHRTSLFLRSLSPLQAERLAVMADGGRNTWRTAYRRTRHGVATWEIRNDQIAGCLRTARGGSSKQAVVEAGRGDVKVRWMTAREYGRLQGVSDDFTFDTVSSNQAMFGFGDAVCVPVIEWIAATYLRPLMTENDGGPTPTAGPPTSSPATMTHPDRSAVTVASSPQPVDKGGDNPGEQHGE